jgi:hypothetical protein
MVETGTRSSSSRQHPSKSTTRSAANALHRNCEPPRSRGPRRGRVCRAAIYSSEPESDSRRTQYGANRPCGRGLPGLRLVGHLGCSSMQCCGIRSSPPSGRLNLLNGQQTCTAIDRNSRSAFADRPSTTRLHGGKVTRSCRIGKIAPSARRIAPAPVSWP